MYSFVEGFVLTIAAWSKNAFKEAESLRGSVLFLRYITGFLFNGSNRV
jgi:hypothetical protein